MLTPSPTFPLYLGLGPSRNQQLRLKRLWKGNVRMIVMVECRLADSACKAKRINVCVPILTLRYSVQCSLTDLTVQCVVFRY
jgi:hypothetical protein